MIELVNDEEKFMQAYKVIEEKDKGSNFRIIKPHLSPQENYHERVILSVQVNSQLERNHPELFSEPKKLHQEIKRIEAEIKDLSKKY